MRTNASFLAWNRGIISPKALARVDLDRTRLSAEVYKNWIPKTTGAMTIRPGTKYFGSSMNDSGAEWLEFVASTDDVALLEITNAKLRIWQGSDGHNLALLGRPRVATTMSFSDTGWNNSSTGGAFATAAEGLIPEMSGGYTANGVTISASKELTQQGGQFFPAWMAADRDDSTRWIDTGEAFVSPVWWQVNFGSGNTKAVTSYDIQADVTYSSRAPKTWTLQCNDVDTGTGWTTVDSRSNQTGWASFETRTFTRLDVDTGTVEAFRYWRFNITAVNGTHNLIVAEFQMYDAANAQQAKFSNGTLTLNASSIGAIAKATRRTLVGVADTGIEHSIALNVSRGPVTFRVGSTLGDDNYVSETSLGTGYHNLAFTPNGEFYTTIQSEATANKIVNSIAIGDSGTVEITAPWSTNDLENIRYDQSADVVYVDCDDVRPSKIERRGTGRSWSVVDYAPNNGPFLPSASSTAKLSVSHFFGNTTMNSSIPFFTSGHVGGLIRIFHEGQGGQWRLGALDAYTDPIEVTGIDDTGTAGANNERRIIFSASGVWSGRITIERSFDSADYGFKSITDKFGTTATDTGTFTKTVDDPDSNLKVWYRAKITTYNSGVATVNVTYNGGSLNGIARITGYNSNTSVDVEVLSRFSDTGVSASWQVGYWSSNRGFPSAVALHGGRLCHANRGSMFLSVSDDYENFDDETTGDAAPIIRTLGAGPVDDINYLISRQRLVVGTSGAELALVSSSLDEPVTRTNCSIRGISTQGAANIRVLPMDDAAIMVQRSKSRAFMLGANAQGEYAASELTLLVPDLMAAGVVSVAIQRQPDTRVHFVLADGTVAILTYEPGEEVICWSTWETDGAVEKAMVLPGVAEDAVYYHVRRTVNSATKRYLEKWALESDCLGDTGLSWIADCAKSFTDTGRNASLTGFSHLATKSVVVWADDTGQSTPGKDLSPDVAGVQTTYAVSAGGTITLSQAVHHAVAGLPYTADWKSAKLAYGAEAGSALGQLKRVAQLAVILYKVHNRGLFFGSDTGNLDPLPQVIDGGATVDPDKIFETFDQVSFPFPGTLDADARLHLRAKAPRPCTVLAAVPSVGTNERV